jgi:hypothetical protein
MTAEYEDIFPSYPGSVVAHEHQQEFYTENPTHLLSDGHNETTEPRTYRNFSPAFSSVMGCKR